MTSINGRCGPPRLSRISRSCDCPTAKRRSRTPQARAKMALTVHAYSDTPARRLVGIGTRILREGDYVAPGLQLEAITLDGMILRYKGYRFRRGVK